MCLNKLLNIPSTACNRFINLLLCLIFHYCKLFNTCCSGSYDILYFCWFFTLLMKLNMICNTFRTKRLNTICSFANICYWVFRMWRTRNRNKTWSTWAIYWGHLSPSTSRCYFWVKHLSNYLNFYNENIY